MATNDDTLYLGNATPQNIPTPPVPVTPNPVPPIGGPAPAKSGNGAKRAAVVGAAVVGGAAVGVGGAAVAANVITDNEEPIVDDAAATTDDQPFHVTEGGLKVVDIDDGKSFAQAFAEAREIVGPGGVFTWRGGYYGTYYDSEWNAMTPEEQAHYHQHVDSEMLGDDYVAKHLHNYTPHHDVAHHYHQPDHIVHHHIHHVVEPVIAQAEPAINIDTVNINYTGAEDADQVLAANDFDNNGDVRVLGVQDMTIDDGSQVTVGGLQMNGQDVYVVDTNTDRVFDVAMSDMNNNGTFDSDEVHDISDAHLTVGDLEAAQIAQGDDVQVLGDDSIYTGNEIDYTNDAQLQVDNDYDDSSYDSSANDDYYASNDSSYDDSSSYDSSSYDDGGGSYDDGGGSYDDGGYVDDGSMMA